MPLPPQSALCDACAPAAPSRPLPPCPPVRVRVRARRLSRVRGELTSRGGTCRASATRPRRRPAPGAGGAAGEGGQRRQHLRRRLGGGFGRGGAPGSPGSLRRPPAADRRRGAGTGSRAGGRGRAKPVGLQRAAATPADGVRGGAVGVWRGCYPRRRQPLCGRRPAGAPWRSGQERARRGAVACAAVAPRCPASPAWRCGGAGAVRASGPGTAGPWSAPSPVTSSAAMGAGGPPAGLPGRHGRRLRPSNHNWRKRTRKCEEMVYAPTS